VSRLLQIRTIFAHSSKTKSDFSDRETFFSKQCFYSRENWARRQKALVNRTLQNIFVVVLNANSFKAFLASFLTAAKERKFSNGVFMVVAPTYLSEGCVMRKHCMDRVFFNVVYAQRLGHFGKLQKAIGRLAS
jgi:hypothetical protein